MLAQLVHQADAHATYTHEREVAIARAFADRYATERNLLQAICLIAVAVGGSLWLTSKITEQIVASVRDDPRGFRARVADINIGEIAAASIEHSRGIDQVNLTISRPAIPSSLPSASRCAHGLRRAAQFPVPPSECTPRRPSRPMRGRVDLGHALLNQPNDEYPKKALHVRTANRVPLIPVRSYRGPIAPRVDGGVRFTPWPHEPSQTIRRRAGEPTRRRIQSHRRSP
ncbi:hypothetical protein EMIT0158MI4_160014 [Burkholderia ambifaria]